MPHCPNCDYDLTGLDLPHRCPECGYLADPLAERESAVAWYASWKGLFFRNPPPMALAYLGDRRCRQRARRRGLLLLLLPWLMATSSVLLVNSVEVVQTRETWWERPDRPGEKLHQRTHTYSNRLLAFDLDFDLFSSFDPGPVSGGKRFENTETSLRLTWPSPDSITVMVFIAPLAIGLLGVFFLDAGLYVYRAVAQRRIDRGGHWPLATLLAPWYAIGALCWLLAMGGTLALELGSSDDVLEIVFGCIFWAAPLVYGLGAVYVAWRTVRNIRPPLFGLLPRIGLLALCVGWLAALIGCWFLIGLVAEQIT